MLDYQMKIYIDKLWEKYHKKVVTTADYVTWDEEVIYKEEFIKAIDEWNENRTCNKNEPKN